jgi:hypothetical protein
LESLATIPPEYRDFLQRGFQQLGAVSPDRWPGLLTTIRDASPYPSRVELQPLSVSLGLELRDAASLVGACRLLFGMLSLRSSTPTEFIDAAIKTSLLAEGDRAIVTRFAELVGQNKADLSKGFDTSALQHSVLPSLTDFQAKADIRVEISSGRVTTAAAVAVVHIDTDATDMEIWFQMTRPQIVALQGQLTQLLEDLSAAEASAAKLI